MASITITIPDGLVADVRSALGRLYDDEIEGMTDKQKLAHHLRATLAPHVRAVRRASDAALQSALAAREANNLNRSSASATDASAVSSAESAVDAATNAAIAEVV